MSNITPTFTWPNYAPMLTSTSGPEPSGSSSVYLTPDALMAYCQSRLDSIDGQIRTGLGLQQQRIQEGVGLQGVLETLQKYAGGTTSRQDCLEMEQSLRDQIDGLLKNDPSFPGLGRLMQAYNDLVFTGTGGIGDNPMKFYPGYPPAAGGHQGDALLNTTDMQNVIAAVSGSVSDLNSGAELQMIKMQSLMSQRQTAVQLSTNLVQALGDQASKIAQNIGH